MRDVYVLGVGAHPWGKFPGKPLTQMAIEAASKALEDAGLEWRNIGALVSCSSHFCGGMGWGNHGNELIQEVNANGLPVYNITDACAVGGVAVNTGYLMVASGQYDAVMVVAAEKPPEGMLPLTPASVEEDITNTDYVRWAAVRASNPIYWGLETIRRMKDFGTTETTLAKASVLMHKNAVPNPLARFRKAFTVEQVLASALVSYPLRVYELCAVSDGAAAVILGSAREARKRGTNLVSVAGSSIGTRQFGDAWMNAPYYSFPKPSGPQLSDVVAAENRAFQIAGMTHQDIDFIELQDNSSWHVLAWPEYLGFCQPGQGDYMLEHGEFEINGKLPINASGGFLSFGEATTAQGILQVCELTWQLRGECKERQIQNAKVGLSVSFGLGGTGTAVILKK